MKKVADCDFSHKPCGCQIHPEHNPRMPCGCCSFCFAANRGHHMANEPIQKQCWSCRRTVWVVPTVSSCTYCPGQLIATGVEITISESGTCTSDVANGEERDRNRYLGNSTMKQYVHNRPDVLPNDLDHTTSAKDGPRTYEFSCEVDLTVLRRDDIEEFNLVLFSPLKKWIDDEGMVCRDYGPPGPHGLYYTAWVKTKRPWADDHMVVECDDGSQWRLRGVTTADGWFKSDDYERMKRR